tara:strand:+ start:355 stop:1152 length:798 start_codon:yes stop_codon:yes gene_type:complete
MDGKEINKFHALQLFTDTFAAETVHLTNQAIGIYIRLLCFAWTKNAKPFTTGSAYRICQCTDNKCIKEVYDVLEEFFQMVEDEEIGDKISWTHKRLVQEHEYLTEKYKKRSEAGKKGGLARSKTKAPIPIPSPIPNINKYDPVFEELWNKLERKKGSKFKAHDIWLKLWSKGVLKETDTPELIEAYNNQIKNIEDDTFIPHFTTWLNQRRWENEEKQEIPDLIKRLEKLGYKHYARDGNMQKFEKDGKYYKVDVYDEKHQLIIEQ